jgi:uncharacterized SAM-binding protein YcdF (DUF218 family)
MFFILSKTIGVAGMPSHALALLALLGAALLLAGWRAYGRRILAFCVIVFVVVGTLPIGPLLILVLENRFPPYTETSAPPDGIIVPGGPIDAHASLIRGHTVIVTGAERLTELPALARRFPQARIIFTGGNPSLTDHGPSEAQFAVPLLESLGVPRQRIEAESRSRNTAENAMFTSALVHPKPSQRWLLVTSALHMPRAVGAFRKAGFVVEPYPVNWLSDPRGLTWRWLVPSLSWTARWGAMDDAAKEWIGLVAYWLTGRSSALFPAPEPELARPDQTNSAGRSP